MISLGTAVSQEMASREQLVRENVALKQQLSSWHKLAVQIADREVRLAGFLAQKGSQQGAPPKRRVDNGAAASAALLQEDRTEQTLENAVKSAPRYAVIALEFVLAAMAAFFMYEFRGWFCPSAVMTKKFLGRHLGAAVGEVEVSELRLGNLRGIPMQTSVCVSIQAGAGHALKTRATVFPEEDPGKGCFLSFDEHFQLRIPSVRGNCVISVLDQDAPGKEVIAWAEVGMNELVQMACHEQEYFRLNLHVHSCWWDGPRGHMAGSRPFVAMRLCLK